MRVERPIGIAIASLLLYTAVQNGNSEAADCCFFELLSQLESVVNDCARTQARIGLTAFAI
jgi:hypothetical protein